MSADHIEKRGDIREGYDHHEARSGMLALWSSAVVLVLIVSIVAMYWLTMVTEDQQYAENVGKKFWEISQETKAREDEQLYHYGYIDKGKGVVRIPVERAMQLVAAEAAQGKVSYNTKTYPVKAEPLGGAQGEALIVSKDNVVAAPAAAPAAEAKK